MNMKIVAIVNAVIQYGEIGSRRLSASFDFLRTQGIRQFHLVARRLQIMVNPAMKSSPRHDVTRIGIQDLGEKAAAQRSVKRSSARDFLAFAVSSRMSSFRPTARAAAIKISAVGKSTRRMLVSAEAPLRSNTTAAIVSGWPWEKENIFMKMRAEAKTDSTHPVCLVSSLERGQSSFAWCCPKGVVLCGSVSVSAA